MTKTEKIFQLNAPWDNPYQGPDKRVLFVCSAGILRSATAARIGSCNFGLNTRACGSQSYALIPISINLITWAHKIFFVNPYNYDVVKENFYDYLEVDELKNKSVVWNIEDEYNYMDPKLQEIIKCNLLQHYEHIRT